MNGSALWLLRIIAGLAIAGLIAWNGFVHKMVGEVRDEQLKSVQSVAFIPSIQAKVSSLEVQLQELLVLKVQMVALKESLGEIKAKLDQIERLLLRRSEPDPRRFDESFRGLQ